MKSVKSAIREDKILYADLLQPGDVILSTTYDPKDQVIVAATRKGKPDRKYSHAAWVIEPFLWFESTREGTGFTFMRIGYVRWQAGERQREVIDVSKYKTIDVFRMPNVDPALLKTNNPEFQALLDRAIGFEYPKLEALAPTTDWFAKLPRLKRSVLNSVSRGKVVNPGAFCSQLVVEMYDSAQAKSFIAENVLKVDLPSGHISPNDLADPDISR